MSSMGRTPCCDRAAVKRGPWSPEEDDALRSYVQRHGSGGNWITMPKKAGERSSVCSPGPFYSSAPPPPLSTAS